MEIYERIIKLRKEYLHLSRREFGEQLGVSESVIVNIEYNRLKKPEQKEPLYQLICAKFDINEEWLRYGTLPMKKAFDTDEYSEVSALIGEKDPKAKQAIINYWKLSDSDKELFWKFVEKFILIEHSPQKPSSSDDDVDREVEDYRRQLELERKAAEKSEALRKNA